MSRSTARIWPIAVGGAVAGALNATLCFLAWPVEVLAFEWHIIPAGSLHGCVLAVIPACAFIFVRRRHVYVQLICALPVGWISSSLSWSAIAFSLEYERSGTLSLSGDFPSPLTGWIEVFGAVSFLYYLTLFLLRSWPHRLIVAVVSSSISGVLGSLWFWIAVEPWYYAALHGVIWGALVGVGSSCAFPRPSATNTNVS